MRVVSARKACAASGCKLPALWFGATDGLRTTYGYCDSHSREDMMEDREDFGDECAREAKRERAREAS